MKLNWTRWVALGAVIALAVGAWGMPVALAAVTSGDKPVFVDVSPQRIADTRFDIGITNPLSSGIPKVLQVTGSVPVAPSGTATVVPDGATGVVLNVTAVNPSRGGFVSVRPGNPAGAPTTSSLNVVTGVTVPNQVTIGLPTGGGSPGRIQIWYQASGGPGTTDILVDVVGYFDDHRHDDRYYTEAQTRDLIFDQRTFVGWLDGSNGSKRDGGAYTSSRSGTGAYNVTFVTTGLGVVPAQMPPNPIAVANNFCANGTIAQTGWSAYTTVGDEVTNFSIAIETFNAAGVAADCDTQFHINFAAPPSLEISDADAVAAADPTSEFPAGTTVVCRNEPTGAVCAPAD